MDAKQRIAVLESDSTALAAAARKGLDTPVESCPTWTVADVVTHVGNGQRWAAYAIRNGTDANWWTWTQMPADPAQLVDWFEAGADALLDALSKPHEEPPVHLLWHTPSTTGEPQFIVRRTTNEAVIHRWDAEDAHGTPQPIPVDAAIDALDEMLMAWLPWVAADGRTAQGEWSGESVWLECTDAPGAWTVRFAAPGTVRTERGGHQANATAGVRGDASSLVLFVMNRIGLDGADFETSGDREVLVRWKPEVRFGNNQFTKS